MKAVLKVAWVLACATVVSGLVGELVLRVQRRTATSAARRFAEANVFESARELAAGGGEGVWLQPEIAYRPGAVATLQAGGESYEIRINSLGFRTHEFRPHKPAGTLRVLCIGGSTTAQGRTNDETYPAWLESKLRLACPKLAIEVLNLGISGTRSNYWLARLDRLFELEPDLVIQYEFVNDLFFDQLKRYSGEHRVRTTLAHSLLASRLLAIDPAELDAYLLVTLRRFRSMAQEAKAHGAAYIVGSFAAPDPERVGADFRGYLDHNVEAWSGESGLRSYAEYHRLLVRHNQRLKAFAPEHGLVLAPIDEQISDPGLFIDICHMTSRGIERLAEAFQPAVLKVIDSAGR